MSRTVPEWIGKTDNETIPPRVKLRVFDNQLGCCAGCGFQFRGRLKPEYDHIIALINGGENRESNIQALCEDCHSPKTAKDVALKSRIYQSRLRTTGIRRRKGPPMIGSRDSKWKRKMDGTVVRRS